MLSAFPTLFSYELVVPFIFRIVIGLTFIWFGYRNGFKNREEKINLLSNFKLSSSPAWLWLIALAQALGGLLLFVGAYTQIVSLIFSVMLVVAVVTKHNKPDARLLPQGTLLLLLLITASLLFLGPGFYAFDLPL